MEGLGDRNGKCFPVSSPTLTPHPSEACTAPTSALLLSSQITSILETQTLVLNMMTELILKVLSYREW